LAPGGTPIRSTCFRRPSSIRGHRKRNGPLRYHAEILLALDELAPFTVAARIAAVEQSAHGVLRGRARQ
jgi:hypothetical protein